MSILDRLNLLVRSNLNDTLGKRSSAAREALSEMEDSLREARRRQAELRRGEKQLIAQIREARDKADQWEERAMLALRNDDEELAREALLVKNNAMRNARQLRDQLDDHRAHMQDIERALEALEHKLEGTKNRLEARSDNSQKRPSESRSPNTSDDKLERKWDEELRRRTGQSPEKSSSSRPVDPEVSETFDTSGKFREMDRMASKIDGMEAEIEAMRELDDTGGDSRRAELEERFRSMEQRRKKTGLNSSTSSKSSDSKRPRRSKDDEKPPIDDDLSDLKKKFE